MRKNNMRGAFGALLLAGAAYAWKNRGRLTQQLESLRGLGGRQSPDAGAPYRLPDNSAVEQRDFDRPSTGVEKREFGGTRM